MRVRERREKVERVGWVFSYLPELYNSREDYNDCFSFEENEFGRSLAR